MSHQGKDVGSHLHHPYYHMRERKEGQWQGCDVKDMTESQGGHGTPTDPLSVAEMEMDLHTGTKDRCRTRTPSQNTGKRCWGQRGKQALERKQMPGRRENSSENRRGKGGEERRRGRERDRRRRKGGRGRVRERNRDRETDRQTDRQRERENQDKRQTFSLFIAFSLDAQRLELESLGRDGQCQERMKGQRGDPNGHPD